MSAVGRLVTVVEDEETIREMICLALSREGHRTEAFGDGIQAWEAFGRALPDLVILDIGLPRLDGLEICKRLRGRSDTLPIIFVTSREEEFDRVLGLEIGADDYLCKPFSMRELMARVKVLLRRASIGETARSDEDQSLTIGALTIDPLRDRLGQVFENIVQNAVSFAPPGSVVEISASNTAGSVIVTVGDRGPGLPEAHLDRVFERFFSCRPEDASDRRQHAGLGLAIARTIVEGYGGSIHASHRAGGGAEFEVRLRSA